MKKKNIKSSYFAFSISPIKDYEHSGSLGRRTARERSAEVKEVG